MNYIEANVCLVDWIDRNEFKFDEILLRGGRTRERLILKIKRLAIEKRCVP